MGAPKLKPADADLADWPEFAEWLALTDVLEVHEQAGNAMTDDEFRASGLGAKSDRLYGRYFELMDALTTKPIKTERQMAMALAVWIYDHERRGGTLRFDLTDYRSACEELFVKRFVLAAGKRVAVLLPDVPLKFPVEG